MKVFFPHAASATRQTNDCIVLSGIDEIPLSVPDISLNEEIRRTVVKSELGDQSAGERVNAFNNLRRQCRLGWVAPHPRDYNPW